MSVLKEAVGNLYEINGLYQDIEVILTDKVGLQMLDGSVYEGGLTPEEKLARILELNGKIGAITAEWI